MKGYGIGLAIVVVAGGCSDPVGDAADRLAIVEKVGSPKAKCEARRALAQAHLQAKHQREYYEQTIHANIACQSAELDALYGASDAGIVADNLETEALR